MGESDSREGLIENGTGEEKSTFDRRNGEGKKGSESRCDGREVDNRDVDRKKCLEKETRKKGTTAWRKVNSQVDTNRRSYSEAD